MKKIVSFSIIASALMIGSCAKIKVDECTGETCGAQTAHIDVGLFKPNGKPYLLDSYTVVTQVGGEVVLSKTINPATDTTGYYVVISDAEKSKVTVDGVYFNFIGKKGGVEVVNLPYRIAHNCCDVVQKSGLSIDTIK